MVTASLYLADDPHRVYSPVPSSASASAAASSASSSPSCWSFVQAWEQTARPETEMRPQQLQPLHLPSSQLQHSRPPHFAPHHRQPPAAGSLSLLSSGFHRLLPHSAATDAAAAASDSVLASATALAASAASAACGWLLCLCLLCRCLLPIDWPPSAVQRLCQRLFGSSASAPELLLADSALHWDGGLSSLRLYPYSAWPYGDLAAVSCSASAGSESTFAFFFHSLHRRLLQRGRHEALLLLLACLLSLLLLVALLPLTLPPASQIASQPQHSAAAAACTAEW